MPKLYFWMNFENHREMIAMPIRLTPFTFCDLSCDIKRYLVISFLSISKWKVLKSKFQFLAILYSETEKNKDLQIWRPTISKQVKPQIWWGPILISIEVNGVKLIGIATLYSWLLSISKMTFCYLFIIWGVYQYATSFICKIQRLHGRNTICITGVLLIIQIVL